MTIDEHRSVRFPHPCRFHTISMSSPWDLRPARCSNERVDLFGEGVGDMSASDKSVSSRLSLVQSRRLPLASALLGRLQQHHQRGLSVKNPSEPVSKTCRSEPPWKSHFPMLPDRKHACHRPRLCPKNGGRPPADRQTGESLIIDRPLFRIRSLPQRVETLARASTGGEKNPLPCPSCACPLGPLAPGGPRGPPDGSSGSSFVRLGRRLLL
ncbi:hypothetical protein HDK77DRAFT_246577 [Phyllosticta capitalensis]|uniref:Uncharacterized protein n=1 Tax=Phyllosticta capitalensis TaxID=121624 RepID=A0ABR1YMR5_9PEZI